MNIWEVVKYGLAVLGIGTILWMTARTTIRFLKSKGILNTRKMSLNPWKKKEEQQDDKENEQTNLNL